MKKLVFRSIAETSPIRGVFERSLTSSPALSSFWATTNPASMWHNKMASKRRMSLAAWFRARPPISTPLSSPICPLNIICGHHQLSFIPCMKQLISFSLHSTWAYSPWMKIAYPSSSPKLARSYCSLVQHRGSCITNNVYQPILRLSLSLSLFLLSFVRSLTGCENDNRSFYNDARDTTCLALSGLMYGKVSQKSWKLTFFFSNHRCSKPEWSLTRFSKRLTSKPRCTYTFLKTCMAAKMLCQQHHTVWQAKRAEPTPVRSESLASLSSKTT